MAALRASSSKPVIGDVAHPRASAASMAKDAAMVASRSAYSRERPRSRRCFWKPAMRSRFSAAKESSQRPEARYCDATSSNVSSQPSGSATKASSSGASRTWRCLRAAACTAARTSGSWMRTTARACMLNADGEVMTSSRNSRTSSSGRASGRKSRWLRRLRSMAANRSRKAASVVVLSEWLARSFMPPH